MAPTRLVAALLVAGLVPAAGAAQSAESFVEVFRQGCLEHIPDFAGSEEAFGTLGFGGEAGRFVRGTEGTRMRAEIYERTVDSGRGCVLASEIGADAPVVAAVETLVTDLSEGRFRHREAERGGKRVNAFIWRTGAWEVLVVVLPHVAGMRALNVTVGEAAR